MIRDMECIQGLGIEGCGCGGWGVGGGGRILNKWSTNRERYISIL